MNNNLPPAQILCGEWLVVSDNEWILQNCMMYPSSMEKTDVALANIRVRDSKGDKQNTALLLHVASKQAIKVLIPSPWRMLRETLTMQWLQSSRKILTPRMKLMKAMCSTAGRASGAVHNRLEAQSSYMRIWDAKEQHDQRLHHSWSQQPMHSRVFVAWRGSGSRNSHKDLHSRWGGSVENPVIGPGWSGSKCCYEAQGTI